MRLGIIEREVLGSCDLSNKLVVFDFSHSHVSDGGFNPGLTVMAVASKVADHIVQQLNKKDGGNE